MPIRMGFCLCCVFALGSLFPAWAAAATEFESPLPPFQPRLDSSAYQPLPRRPFLAPNPGTPPRSKVEEALPERANAQEFNLLSGNAESRQHVGQAIEIPCDINEFVTLP